MKKQLKENATEYHMVFFFISAPYSSSESITFVWPILLLKKCFSEILLILWQCICEIWQGQCWQLNTFSIPIGPQYQGLSTQRLQPKYGHNQHHTHWNNTLTVMKACSRSIYEMLVWLSFRGVWFSLTADAGWPTGQNFALTFGYLPGVKFMDNALKSYYCK